MKLLDYIQGFRKGKDAHRLEKESMKDPFLADAMDGYQQIEGKHEERIKELQTLITALSTKNRNSYAIIWSIAACLIIGVGISSYFLFLKKNMPENTFLAKETTSTTISPKTPKEEIVSFPSEIKTKRDSNHASAKTVTPKTEKKPTIVKEKVSARTAIDTDITNNLIRGKVTDKNGTPLIGVNITYRQIGREHRTITDINGNFSLTKENNDDKILFSYIGHDTMELLAETTQPMHIIMKESNPSILDEVVIAGTGTQKKIAVTGAVTAVDVDKLKQAPSPNAMAGAISKENQENLMKDSKQIMPEPVIGMKQYQKYLKKNMIQPTDETCNGIKGTVILTFLVNEKGRPFQIKIKKGLCESADKEAIRLIQEGPNWTHGNKLVEIKVKFK